MKNEKEILKKLIKIAVKQQLIISKLAGHSPRKNPGEPLEEWENLGISEEEWNDFNDQVNEKEWEELDEKEEHEETSEEDEETEVDQLPRGWHPGLGEL